MRNKLLLLFAAVSVAASLCCVGCDGGHFITDKHYRAQVHQDFLARQILASGRADALFACLDTLKTAEREAMEFLYAYMPYSDLADYDGTFFLDQVRYAFAARDTFSWGRKIPEDVFRHFVLVYRVNNENLDTARMVMFQALKDRVKHMTMEEAALEVNHWCHEHVAYRASDVRTSAPLATMRTSLGRCGEESTFAVTALRAVGIPARQCYTPRWAHCDDNHAWVEVWVDGEWKFLGACEPDPALDMGWFSVPSTRTMMVHSKAFGRYRGDEEVVKETSLYSELNLLSHYAPTRRVTVEVHDGDGRAVCGAQVKFKLYNYSEFYTLASMTTDSLGRASLTTGLGDLLVWGCKDDRYDYRKLDVRQQDTLVLRLWRNGTDADTYDEQMDIVPPVAGTAKVVASEQATDVNNRRLAYEDSLRNSYTATFPTSENFKDFVHTDVGMTDEQLWDVIHRSEGNYADLAAFVNRRSDSSLGPLLYRYLSSYSDKDLRDITTDVLESHWCERMPAGMAESVYELGVMPARVSNEMVRPWRQYLKEALQKDGVKPDAESIRQWTLKNIAVDDTGNYYGCPISPRGVFELRHSDAHSRDIFFVAACRALQVPAYLDNATNIIYTHDDSVWMPVSFVRQAPTVTATLILEYHGHDPQTPFYWSHFALAKYENGDFETFDYENDDRLTHFPATLTLEPGYYCLYTGNRYPEGDVLSRISFFEVKADVANVQEVVIRPLTDRTVVLADSSKVCIDPNVELLNGRTTAGNYASEGMVYIHLGDYREPSKHLVKELQASCKALQQWGGRVYMVVPPSVDAKSWNLPNTDCVVERAGQLDALGTQVRQAVEKKSASTTVEYPFVAVIDSRGKIWFHSQGYRIGLAEQILRHIPGR